MDAEVGVVQAFVHAAGTVEALGLLLKHVARKVKPFGQVFVQHFGCLAGLGHFRLQAQGQQPAHAGAGSPPVVSHGVEGMDAGRFQQPVPHAWLHAEAV